MKDLIIKLLKENGRLILPDFGAFIVKTKSPFTVIFNEFLQYNDGALITAAEDKFKLERDSAAEKITEYIKDVTTKLNQGETIDLSEIGILSKSATGKIALNAINSDVPTVTSESKDNPPATVEFDITAAENKEIKTPKKEAEPIINKEATIPSTSGISSKPIEVKKTVSQPYTSKTPEKPTEEKKDKFAKEPMPISEYYEDYSSRNRINVILWIILIALINGVIVGYFIFDDEIRGFLGKNDSNKNEQLIETPEIVDDIIPITEDSVLTEEELVIEDIHDGTIEAEQSSTVLSGKKYYVVAGVFKDEANADKLVANLRQKGYNAEKFGKIGTLHAVSYEVFPTKPEADKFMFKIKNEIDSEAWIRVVN